MSARRIYLVASTGFPNYGDELVGARWLRYLARTAPDAEVWLDSPSPGNSQLLLGGLHPNVRFVDTLFRIAWAAPSEDPDDLVEFGAEAVRNPGLVPRFALGVELLQTTDVFHVLGGGYINSVWPRHLLLLAAGSELAASSGARVALTGAGLAPAVGVPSLMQRVLDRYAVVDVRDEMSRGIAADQRATVIGDDVLLDLDDDSYDHRDSRSVMVCAQSDHVDAGVEAVAQTVLGTLEKWGVDGSQVGYVETMPGEDRRVFELLEPSLADIRFYPFVEVWRDGFPARRGQRWITTRYHAHLLAAAAQAWGVAVPVKPGYNDVEHSSLAESTGWGVAEPGSVSEVVHGESGLRPSMVADMAAAKQAVADAVYAE
ncbi:MAG TPA: polysaccharide pyruvyl transferase family protein [Nocardioidaceae bacterium]|nr:polysaccharide pyruvyl transferase family protein [Nocardioidaceae bacterium]